MNDKKFSTVITAIGAARLAEAASGGAPLVIKQMGVGDGGGALPVPEPSQTGLINETYRAALNKLSVSDQSDSIIEAEMIMPPTTGGYWLREVALFSDDGACIVVGNMPPTYKPLLSEGSGRFQIIRVLIEVSSDANVSLIADPSIVLATVESVQAAADGMKDYADRQLGLHEQSRNHPDATLAEKGFTQLSNATDSDSENMAATPAAIKAAIAAAVREGWEISHPKGISLFFFENVDPNQLWPWSTWEYTGEDRTVRIAKRDGSNVGKFGGSDTAVIERQNLPASKIPFKGNTGYEPEKTLKTTTNGQHHHQGGTRAPGETWREETRGTDNQGRVTLNNTSDAGDHEHEVVIPGHGHEVSGETDALGSGEAISIVESHVLQMCWHRVA
ncbi:Phage tail fibre repeat [Serratia ficaria]|uniref:phage tail protein n=1 Tax=Serratia ficaria TaxID=61651 RepID=UPI00217CB256|nr:phage tail protein [Serratia ficaria]CAI1107397.1 Phage tail fibre repeat [Serratia ficaria]CAI1810130.1 Phage tail fibre repeat [Serratia ficaria]CAI2489896.1 Phage tail fibre repeat [Serratia ficaria]CAI2511616.1 Phage tail fibre repeat [Serratia ficaria]CAI2791711.1 Phage tail fibre repeat [Serratia ficaria]